jgi:nucleotide-binding universal stress UspA family protein
MPFSIRKIVVATDFGPLAGAAADAALELARRFGAQLTLLHVIPLSQYMGYATSDVQAFDVAGLQESVRASVQTAGTAEVERLAGYGVNVEFVSLDGPAPAAICAYVEEHETDLIAIGSHGRTGLGRLLLGSVAESVVRHAKAPVLVIREQ